MRVQIVAALAASLALAACADSTGPVGVRPTASAASPDRDDPFGLRRLTEVLSSRTAPENVRVTPQLHVRWLGTGDLVSRVPAMPLDERRPTSAGESPKEPSGAPAFGPGRIVVFNTATRNTFLVTFHAELLDAIHLSQERAGLTLATTAVRDPDAAERDARAGEVPAADLGEARAAGWSNGVDSRIRFTTTTAWPRRAMASFTYGGNDSRCSGTLIGPRHVITAAHCIVAQGTNNWATITITPARNGVGSAPFGSSTIMPEPAPGTEAWYFVPAEWLDPDTPTPRRWDWGMLVIPDRLGDQTGWLGYVARSISALQGAFNYNRGYPSCDPDFAERPEDCVTGAMYGDLQQCEIGGGAYQFADGWNRLLSLSCDLSRGHSGSSAYHYFYDPALGAYWPVVSMMVVSHTCLTCTPADDFPNWARRIAPIDLQTISALRAAFP